MTRVEELHEVRTYMIGVGIVAASRKVVYPWVGPPGLGSSDVC